MFIAKKKTRFSPNTYNAKWKINNAKEARPFRKLGIARICPLAYKGYYVKIDYEIVGERRCTVERRMNDVWKTWNIDRENDKGTLFNGCVVLSKKKKGRVVWEEETIRWGRWKREFLMTRRQLLRGMKLFIP